MYKVIQKHYFINIDRARSLCNGYHLKEAKIIVYRSYYERNFQSSYRTQKVLTKSLQSFLQERSPSSFKRYLSHLNAHGLLSNDRVHPIFLKSKF